MPVVTNGTMRKLGSHIDTEGYGDVIITVGIFGEADITLDYAAQKDVGKTQILPVARKAVIGEGMAYVIWGQSRWKMKHDAIIGKCEQSIPGVKLMDGGKPVSIARCGVTLRYYRRSWCILQQRSKQPQVGPPCHTFRRKQLVDAFSHSMSGCPLNVKHYPYTYPALVLEVEDDALLVLYLSDGLVRDDGHEAASTGRVPFECAIDASANVIRRCHSIPGTKSLLALHLDTEMEE